MTLDKAINEWVSKSRRMGCVSATDWLCKRVDGFKPKRIHRWTQQGDTYSHVVATNGFIDVDLAPYADKPDE